MRDKNNIHSICYQIKIKKAEILSPRSYNCSAITNLSFLEKARVLSNLGIQFPDNKGSSVFSKPESLQSHGSNTRATKALSFCTKDSMVVGICQAKKIKCKNHMYKIPVTGYDALRYGNMPWELYVHF